MRTIFVVTTLAAAACGSPREPLVPHPQGYAAHMEAADAHSDKAQQYGVLAPLPEPAGSTGDSYSCGDTVLADQATSGGERLVQSVPCWDSGEEVSAHRRYLAEHEQQLAQDERRTAANLVEAELAACRGLPVHEIEHSPFAHRKEIAEVIPHRETGTLRGVRIVFKPVPGLTADWMRQAITCHRARFERMGEPAIYLPEDPTLVARAITTVELHSGHIEVMIETGDDTSAQVALDRAMDLVRPRTARN